MITVSQELPLKNRGKNERELFGKQVWLGQKLFLTYVKQGVSNSAETRKRGKCQLFAHGSHT